MILAPRYLPRLAATIGLFIRYGLADFAKQQGLQGIAPEPGEEDAEGPSPEKARALRNRLVELGPAYVKLGQVLSTRSDLLGPEFIQELSKLQDSVTPAPADGRGQGESLQLGAAYPLDSLVPVLVIDHVVCVGAAMLMRRRRIAFVVMPSAGRRAPSSKPELTTVQPPVVRQAGGALH